MIVAAISWPPWLDSTLSVLLTVLMTCVFLIRPAWMLLTQIVPGIEGHRFTLTDDVESAWVPKDEGPPCPRCLSNRHVARIVYGFPSRAMKQQAGRGKMVLGGCMLGPHKWICKWCGLRRLFGRKKSAGDT